MGVELTDWQSFWFVVRYMAQHPDRKVWWQRG
jgi:hypothetical protein